MSGGGDVVSRRNSTLTQSSTRQIFQEIARSFCSGPVLASRAQDVPRSSQTIQHRVHAHLVCDLRDRGGAIQQAEGMQDDCVAGTPIVSEHPFGVKFIEQSDGVDGTLVAAMPTFGPWVRDARGRQEEGHFQGVVLDSAEDCTIVQWLRRTLRYSHQPAVQADLHCVLPLCDVAHWGVGIRRGIPFYAVQDVFDLGIHHCKAEGMDRVVDVRWYHSGAGCGTSFLQCIIVKARG